MRLKRPFPPDDLLDSEPGRFLPAPEVGMWMRAALIEEGHRTYNKDHAHLLGADIGVVWTSAPCKRKMKAVAGTAELARPPQMLSGWARSRWTWQLNEWFGREPDFLITLYAPYASVVENEVFLALVDHELYHCALVRYTNKGTPIWGIRGHDVEEFVGIVERYGVDAAAGDTRRLVEAARRKPTIGRAAAASVCGVCMAKAA